MSAKHLYIVSFFKEPFLSLEDAKWNVKIAFTRSEAKKYVTGEHIFHYIGEKLHSFIPIKVDEQGNISFGRVIKY